MQMLESNRTRTEQGHTLHQEKAWDCGCGQHLEATGEEALIARVLYPTLRCSNRRRISPWRKSRSSSPRRHKRCSQ